MKSNLIDKRAVLEAIEQELCCNPVLNRELKRRIRKMPSLQPDEQIRWERDLAIQQLKDLGYGLGEKIRMDDDCITRQAAIDAARETIPSDWFDTLYPKLEALPSVQPEPQWIPCSERLPHAEYGESNCVYCYCHDIENGGRWSEPLYFNGSVWCKRTGEVFEYKVLAWYPLPIKPYREKTHDLIDRQDAIASLKEEIYPCESDYDEGYMAALEKAIWIVKEWLPSTKSEIVRCQDCKHSINSATGKCGLFNECGGYDEFCSMGELEKDE